MDDPEFMRRWGSRLEFFADGDPVDRVIAYKVGSRETGFLKVYAADSRNEMIFSERQFYAEGVPEQSPPAYGYVYGPITVRLKDE